MTRVALVFVVLIAPGSAFAQTRLASSAPVWTGSVRCDLVIKGPGYVNHQTHTWTLTGAVPADGNVLEYPATWSVTGEGSLRPTTAQGQTAEWTTQGSAQGERMAIFVRQSDQKLVVLVRHGQLSVPNGTIGTQRGATIGARVQPLSAAASEWRPFPTIEDVATSTHIVKSSVTPFTTRLDVLNKTSPTTSGVASRPEVISKEHSPIATSCTDR